MSVANVKNSEAVRILNEMQSMRDSITGTKSQDSKAELQSFSSLLHGAIDKANAQQNSAINLQEAYEIGDANVSIAQVMVEAQKANISFQTMLQVRNKLINAYREVMNMPL